MTEVHSCSFYCDRPECIKAQRDELRDRLAQPEQKPVPWESFFKRYCPWLEQPEQESFSPEAIRATQAAWKMGYDAAKAEQPEQEPVATVQCINGITIGYLEVMQPVGTKLYTTPPQRKWVDVRDEEIKILWIQHRTALPRYLCFAKALLARAKEENT